jgi:hypothetical protein
MAFPNVVATAKGSTGCSVGGPGITTHVLALPAGVVAGDLVILAIGANNAIGGPNLALSAPGWQVLWSLSGNTTLEILLARVATGPMASVTFTTNENACLGWVAYRYDGSAGGSLDAAMLELATATGNSASGDPPVLTPSWGSDEVSWLALVGCFGQYQSWSAPGGANDVVSQGGGINSFGYTMAGYTKDVAAASYDPAAFSYPFGVSRSWRSWTVGVRFSGRIFRPAAFGAEWGFADSVALVVGGSVTLFGTRLGAVAGFAAGIRFSTAGARQVLLTGGGIETPEMTQGGFEGQVLTFHERRVPTWEDGPASVIEAKGDLIVGTGPGAVDHLPAGTDGWFLSLDATEPTGLRWVSPSRASVDFGETGDIADLDFGDAAAAGSTGEVADAGHIHGMPADPVAALALATGDLIVAGGPGTPVRLPVGADGELLTADAAAPTGVAWAPPAEGTPPALRVYLYATFK